MPRDAVRRTRKWPWITLAILIVAAGAGTAGYFLNNDVDKSPTFEESPTSAVEAPGPAIVAPTGCLGGADRNASMVTTAVGAADRSTTGGIEVATAFMRWLNQFPYPSPADARTVQEIGVSDRAETQDLVAFFAHQPNLSGGLVPDNTPYFLSTVPGVYYVESSSDDQVVVSVGSGLVVNSEMSPTLKGSITVTVVWEGDSWKFVRSHGTRTTQDLFAMGRPFTSGC